MENSTKAVPKKESFLRKYIGVGGLIGAIIGLAYTPLSFFAIGMAYDFEGNAFVEIITIPALPFFLFASCMDLPEAPLLTISAVFFTAVGTGIGACVHCIRKKIKKTKGK